MSDDTKNNAVLWVGGVLLTAMMGSTVAIVTQSSKTSQANQQSLIDDLPAVRAKLDILSVEVADIKSATLSRGEIEAKLEAFSERLQAIEGQISRRFNEVVNRPLEIVADDVQRLQNDVSVIRESVAELKASITVRQP